jgi:hypothetical protein
MRLHTLIIAGLAAMALQVAPAAAAPMTPANGPQLEGGTIIKVGDHHHRRKIRRGCRFDHGRLICGHKHRGHRSGKHHGDKKHHH